VRLYVEEHGQGDPLLLLSGLGYASWSWQRQIPAWSGRFRCIVVDNRGAGRSPKPRGPYSIEQLADDAAEMLDGRRAHVAGFSMGGYIAQTLALRHPQLVERVVLVCTGTGGPAYARLPEETRAAWEAYADRPPAEFARNTMPFSFAPGWTAEHPDEFEQLLRDRLEFPTPMDAWRAQYHACEAFVERATPVEEIAAPTLVVHGDADRIVPYENGVELARRIPGTELVTFLGAGHLLFIEQHDRFNETVLEFLTG
jgi:pimeloyl-ACP methyl ester carboxylesterase